ncbi:MAG: GntR family transcriptional regulator [Candidatus Limnocylindrales bacterium]
MDRPSITQRADVASPSRIDQPGPPGPLPELPALPAPRRLATDAADILRDQILAGGLVRGTHLVEAKIAAQLNVSRGTVREAFRVLTVEGLIVEGTRRGAFVVSLSASDVREIYDVRAAIEGRAAQLIVRAAKPAVLDELEAIVRAIEVAAKAGDVAAVRSTDLDFHAQVCLLSGNRRLHEVFLRHVPAVQTLIRYDDRLHFSLEKTAAQHRPLLDALRSGDPEAAARAFQLHCEEARDLVAPYFDSADDPARAGGRTAG